MTGRKKAWHCYKGNKPRRKKERYRDMKTEREKKERKK